MKHKFGYAAIFAGSLFLGQAAQAITITQGNLAGNLNLASGVLTGGGNSATLVMGGFKFDPVNITSGSGAGNCNLFDGNCFQLNTNATTTMTTEPAGGVFDLNKLSFIIDGAAAEFSVFNVALAGTTLVVTADANGNGGNACTTSTSVFCVEKNEWHTIDFEGSLANVTELLFDNTGTGNVRIGALDATLSTVPLPAAGLMLVAGLGGLAAMRRMKA